MEYDGSLEAMEQINLRIHPTESPGLRPVLEMLYLQAKLSLSHHAVYYRM